MKGTSSTSLSLSLMATTPCMYSPHSSNWMDYTAWAPSASMNPSTSMSSSLHNTSPSEKKGSSPTGSSKASPMTLHTLPCTILALDIWNQNVFSRAKLMRKLSPHSPSTPALSSTPSTISQMPPDAPKYAHIASASSLFSISHSGSHDSFWTAATGTPAHNMTFSRHWIRNLVPHHIPIQLADGFVIHSF